MFSHIKELFTRPSGYTIAKSVRLRSSASAYFNRTLTTPTNNKIWTFSCWFKRGQLTYGASGASGALFFAPSSGSTFAGIYFTPTDIINWYDANGGATVYLLQTTQVFRDPSAWYHLVCVYDSTQATAANRQKMYVNGVQITAFSTASYVAQNTDGRFNSAVSHVLGQTTAATQYFDGYLTEINFIDGQALTPSSFGSTNAITGVWQPAKYTGTYGTNGFYLNFSDNSGATATTIGKDYSGNGNNWTPNNISVTAGVTYDSMLDSPTPYADGGNGRGNYAVGNPLNADGATWSGGNLNFSLPNSTNNAQGTVSVTTGKWYWEVVYSANPTQTGVQEIGLRTRWTSGVVYSSDGSKYVNGTNSAYGATYTTGDVIGVALDMDGSTVTFYKNNTSQGSISLSGSGCVNATLSLAAGGGVASVGSINFGQRPFTYTPPTGYVALNTYNLPASTITNGAAYMAATLYTGNGSTQSITNTVNGISFQPDFVWVKARSLAYSNYLYDSVRGTGTSKSLISDATAAEGAGSANANLTSFDSSGFSLGTTSGINGMNANAGTFVGWQWKAGGSSSSNTNGSITSTVSVGATQGFSVVTWTNPASGTPTIGHGLGVAPTFIIVKDRTFAYNWDVGCTSIGWANRLNLNSTSATSSGFWNSTAPTSTVFTYAASGANSGDSMVAYCFAAVKGFSAFGSYTGNGSTDGPFVYTGFRPRWIMVKNTTNSGGATNWVMQDSSRNGYNPNKTLYANASSAEDSSAYFDILSNGFKVRDTFRDVNTSGDTYIYMAFAESPLKYALAR